MRNAKAKLFYRFIIRLTKCFFHLFYDVKIYGAKHVEKGSAIVAANHTSYLDPPFLAICCPEELHFLAKNELFNNRIFAKIITSLNTHPLKGGSSDVSIFKTIYALLDKGNKVVLFPEGMRTVHNKLAPIKRGVSLLVSKSQSKVIPVYLHGLYDIWNRKKKFPRLYGKVACVFGSPIYWEEFSHLPIKDGQQEFVQALQERMNHLKKWYEDGAEGIPP